MPEIERQGLTDLEIWKKEIDNSLSFQKEWKEEAKKYSDIYRDKHNVNTFHDHERYNIFWANTQTLKPLVYSKLPQPNITRRFLDKDDTSRIASEMMERSLSFFLEDNKVDNVFNKVRDDFLIVGRGVPRVFIDPAEIIEIEKEVEGELQIEEDIDLDTKRIRIEYVPYQSFLTSTEDLWVDIRWVAFNHKMSRSELVERFGKKGKKVNLDSTILNKDEDIHSFKDSEAFQVADIWEIWDKENKEVIWMSQDQILQKQEDNYNLKEFFPVPRPIGSESDPESLLPIPLYRMYKSQAEELNIIDSRIRGLVEQCKFTGVYSSIGEGSDMKGLLNGEDGEFNPLKGVNTQDIRAGIFTKPLSEIITTIAQLNDQKTRVIQNIRDITGLSDIVRGTTLASETATAQRLKGDFAISRIQPLQKEMEIGVRDTVRLMSELIVENYSIEELAKITNLKIVDINTIAEETNKSLQSLLQQGLAQIEDLNSPEGQLQAQQLKEQAEKGFQATMKKPINDLKGYAATPEQLEQIDKLIKSDLNRCLLIDIETDSTVRVDQNQIKQDRFEYVQAISNFSNSMFPLVQAQILTPSAFNEMLAFVSKPFKVGRNLEEFLLSEEEVDQEPEGPSLEEQLAQAENQRKDQELQLKAQEVDIKQQLANVKKAEVKQSQIQFEDNLEFQDVNKEADRRSSTLQDVVKSRTNRVNTAIRESDILGN
jgi:hypothetical protein